MDVFFHNHAGMAEMETDEPGGQTADRRESVIKARASDHSIYLLYPFRVAQRSGEVRSKPHLRLLGHRTGARGNPATHPSVPLKTLVEAPWQLKLTDQLRQKAEDIQRAAKEKGHKSDRQSEERADNVERNKQLAQDNIWRESDWAVAPDMDPQVARLLSQQRENGSSRDTVPG